MSDELLQRAAALLRPVQNFPKPGILFWDIAPLLRTPLIYSHLISTIVKRWRNERIQVVAGFDARGFIFGAAVAQKLGVAFEQIRKSGKLPGATQKTGYELEYGEAEIEMLDDGFLRGKRVLLIDDLLATGGTAAAGAKLVEALGGTVVGFACITEIPILGGRGRLLHYPVQSLISIIENTPVTDVEYCVDMLTLNCESHIGGTIIIKRLNEPIGYAMPGGRIELESAYNAAVRELFEETGCIAKEVFYIETLASLGRDPRGEKISLVVSVQADITGLRGEEGKTIPLLVRAGQMPSPREFVFGHGEFLQRI